MCLYKWLFLCKNNHNIYILMYIFFIINIKLSLSYVHAYVGYYMRTVLQISTWKA